VPWRRPRYELALLALVAVAALSPVHAVNAQDTSRLCLTGALESGHLYADSCLALALDKSKNGNHLYTDKAPGLSALEVPAVEVTRLDPDYLTTKRLWGVRLLTSGIAFVVCAFLLGRVAEGIAPGCGGASLVAFALGTLMAPFAAASFGHVTAATLGFAAFLLAWRRRLLLAGLLAGASVVVEYQAAGIALVVGLYVAVRNVRRIVPYALGAVPGVAALLAYNAIAFGAPWRLSYRYIANGYLFSQNQGVFGVTLPKAYGTYQTLFGAGGLLVVSPVLVAAAWGLVLLARAHRREAIVCAAVTLFFLVVEFGYFLPYGGTSPGPRFLIPALPFLALGLPPAFAARPRLTALLAGFSIVPTIALTLVWSTDPRLHRTVWWELARVIEHGQASLFVRSLTGNALTWIGAGRIVAAVVVAVAAVAALALALLTLPRGTRTGGRSLVVVVGSLAAIVAADASAFAEYPYRTRVLEPPNLLYTSLSASKTVALPGDEVDLIASVNNPQPTTANDAVLVIDLAPGLQLLGPPAVERGPGCTGTTEITCNLDFVVAQQTTPVRFAVRVLAGAADRETVRARSSSAGVESPGAQVTVTTGSS
jgi:hypothetical protein